MLGSVTSQRLSSLARSVLFVIIYREVSRGVGSTGVVNQGLLGVVVSFIQGCSPSKTRALLRHSSHHIAREVGSNPCVERAPLV